MKSFNAPELSLAARLRDLEQIDRAGLTADQHLTAQVLLIVRWYLIERNVPERFFAMTPDQLVDLVVQGGNARTAAEVAA